MARYASPNYVKYIERRNKETAEILKGRKA